MKGGDLRGDPYGGSGRWTTVGSDAPEREEVRVHTDRGGGGHGWEERGSPWMLGWRILDLQSRGSPMADLMGEKADLVDLVVDPLVEETNLVTAETSTTRIMNKGVHPAEFLLELN